MLLAIILGIFLCTSRIAGQTCNDGFPVVKRRLHLFRGQHIVTRPSVECNQDTLQCEEDEKLQCELHNGIYFCCRHSPIFPHCTHSAKPYSFQVRFLIIQKTAAGRVPIDQPTVPRYRPVAVIR